MKGFTGTRLVGEDLACIRGGRPLFSGLSFDLAAGDALFVTGPNGVGKSSLLRVLAGLLPPAAGTVSFTPPDVDDPETAAPAYLGHADALKPLLTVAETLDFWQAVAGPRDPARRRRATAAAAEAFGLGPLAHLPCRALSAGQRRRVALARIAAQRAPVWLLDEPATALDTAGVAAFDRALADHRAGGGIAVIATHAPPGADGARTLELAGFADAAPADPLYRGLTLDEEA